MRRKALLMCMLCVLASSSEAVFGQGPGDGFRRGGVDRRSRGEQGGDRGSRGSDRGGDRGSRGGDRGGRFGAAPQEASGTSSPQAGTKPVARTGAARTTNKKTAASLALPAEYLAKDTNRDGQIGLYEWALTDLSSFKKLDVNGDGFLIPSEFANPGTRTASNSTYTPIENSSASTSRFVVSPGRSPSSTGSPEGLAVVSQTTTGSTDPLTSEGETVFKLRDLNKDDQMDQEEFDGSYRIKRVFEKAKMTFKGPVPKAKFLELYREALLAKAAAANDS